MAKVLVHHSSPLTVGQGIEAEVITIVQNKTITLVLNGGTQILTVKLTPTETDALIGKWATKLPQTELELDIPIRPA